MKKINKDFNLSDLISDDFYYKNRSIHKFKEYRVSCPLCSLDGYYKKSLTIKNDLSVSYCFRCETIFVNEYDPLENEFARNIPSKKIEYKISKLDNLNDYYNVNDNSIIGKNYLLNRNKFIKIDKYKLRSTNKFVIIPFIINNEIIYFQKRFINPSFDEPKHFKPVIDFQPFYFIDNNSNVLVICEGAFDAMACDNLFNEKYDCLALCGKAMSNYQLWLLKELKMYDHIIIFLDETKLSKNLYDNLKNQFIISPKFDIIKSDGDDPEEMLNKNIILEYL